MSDLEKSVTAPDEIEGLGGDEDASWGDYPIDTLLIRHETRTVHDVVRRIDQGSFIMDPDFQRAFIWDEDKQSKLIESVLMRIPLPVFYLAEDSAGRMIVVDGGASCCCVVIDGVLGYTNPVPVQTGWRDISRTFPSTALFAG